MSRHALIIEDDADIAETLRYNLESEGFVTHVALTGEEGMKHCRTPAIISDATWHIFNAPSRECTGNFFIDDVLLYAEGERDFDKYRVDPTKPLMPDFFVPENTPTPPGVSMGAKA